MDIKIEKDGAINIISVSDRLDSNTAGDLEKKFIPKIDAGETQFILDFAELDYISSAGLRVLLHAAKKLNQTDGQVVLCCVKDEVKEVFEIAGLAPIFPIYADRDGAISAFY